MAMLKIQLNGSEIKDIALELPISGLSWNISNNGTGAIFISTSNPTSSADYKKIISANSPAFNYTVGASFFAWSSDNTNALLSFSSIIQ
jgi:hypothetical protein